MGDITYKLNPIWECGVGMHGPVYDWAYKYVNRALNIFYQVRIEGAEKLPKEGPALVLPKHQSYFDIPFMSQAIYQGCGRRMHTIMKKELLYKFGVIPLLGVSGWFWLRCGGIPVDRENTRESIRELGYARSLAEKGELMVVYPEGTRNRGAVGKIESGIIRLWQNAKVELPFIPVGINYEGRNVSVRIGNPILGQKIRVKELADIVQKEIARLSNLPIK